MGPGFRRYRMPISLPASSAIAYTPRPATAGRGRGPTRQRWEGEGRPVPWCSAQLDLWAVLGRDMAGQRCVNPMAASAGMTELRVERVVRAVVAKLADEIPAFARM